MNADLVRKLLAAKPGGYEDYPFGPEALVFKVCGKMYAIVGIRNDPSQVNLKCDPDEAEALRTAYPAIRPGYHMNKRHWNTVTLDGSVPDELIEEMIDTSYALVVRSLTRPERATLG
jgi:predicted DNA-binding protein (MmcQ/YjbR family)